MEEKQQPIVFIEDDVIPKNKYELCEVSFLAHLDPDYKLVKVQKTSNGGHLVTINRDNLSFIIKYRGDPLELRKEYDYITLKLVGECPYPTNTAKLRYGIPYLHELSKGQTTKEETKQ